MSVHLAISDFIAFMEAEGVKPADAGALAADITSGEVVRFEAAAGNIMDSYVHIQGGRGVNVVVVEMKGASEELAHDIAVMKNGHLVEVGTADDILSRPQQEYTRTLLAAVPRLQQVTQGR